MSSENKYHVLSADLAEAELTDGNIISGYASVFDSVNDRGYFMESGCFKDSLSNMKKNKTMPRMFWNHDMWNRQIGKWLDVHEDEKGLFVKGKLMVGMDNERADQLAKELEFDIPMAMSIGIMIDEASLDDDHRLISVRKANLLEISPCNVGSDPGAMIDPEALHNNAKQIKSMLGFRKKINGGGKPTLREFEGLLRDAGFSRKEAVSVALSSPFNNQRDADQIPSNKINYLEGLDSLISNIEDIEF